MESPIRKMLKRNDYNRHKLFRKIKRRRKAQAEQLSKAAEKELKRRLRTTPPIRFERGKNGQLLLLDPETQRMMKIQSKQAMSGTDPIGLAVVIQSGLGKVLGTIRTLMDLDRRMNRVLNYKSFRKSGYSSNTSRKLSTDHHLDGMYNGIDKLTRLLDFGL